MAPHNQFLEKHANDLLLECKDEKQFSRLIRWVFLRGVHIDYFPNTQGTIDWFWSFFDYCKFYHIDKLSRTLSKIMNSSSDFPIIRTLSFFLVYNLLITVKFFNITPETLSELKRTLLFHLQQQLSTEIFPVLAQSVSFLACHVFGVLSVEKSWPEYIDYVNFLTDHPYDYKKGIWLLIDLPLSISENGLKPYGNKIKNKLLDYLGSHEEDEDVWGMAFAACFNMILLLDEDDMAKPIMSRVKNSITELVNEKKQGVLRNGLRILCFFAFKRVWWFSPKTNGLMLDMWSYIVLMEGIESETIFAVNRVMEKKPLLE